MKFLRHSKKSKFLAIMAMAALGLTPTASVTQAQTWKKVSPSGSGGGGGAGGLNTFSCSATITSSFVFPSAPYDTSFAYLIGGGGGGSSAILVNSSAIVIANGGDGGSSSTSIGGSGGGTSGGAGGSGSNGSGSAGASGTGGNGGGGTSGGSSYGQSGGGGAPTSAYDSKGGATASAYQAGNAGSKGYVILQYSAPTCWLGLQTPSQIIDGGSSSSEPPVEVACGDTLGASAFGNIGRNFRAPANTTIYLNTNGSGTHSVAINGSTAITGSGGPATANPGDVINVIAGDCGSSGCFGEAAVTYTSSGCWLRF